MAPFARQRATIHCVFRRTVVHLKRCDPALAGVIRRVGPCRLTARVEGSHFDHLVRAIVYQQLSGKAAATIYGRMLNLYGGHPPSRRELARNRMPTLRRAGLSARKAEYVKDLAPTPDELARLGERWAPCRSNAAWYLWRSLDGG
jgi:3-methyladenine DNA glycosylase/8-oxoguanine DNA glycosylase